MAVSNAPLATIDITALKPSRFLLEHAALPYRDHEGRINVHLCTESEKELSIPGVASSRADIPQGADYGRKPGPSKPPYSHLFPFHY